MPALVDKLAVEFGMSDLPEGVFFSSFDQVESASKNRTQLRGQVHHMKRAFERLELDGILCVDDRPTVFFRNFDSPIERGQLDELHKKAWNQSSATLLVISDPHRVYMFSCLSVPEEAPNAAITDHKSLVTELERTVEVLSKFDLAKQIASGSLYRRHRDCFNSEQAVDTYLVGNLETLSELLLGDRDRSCLPKIHAFLGRLIFTAYLLDREVIHLSDYIRRKNTASLRDFLENVEDDAVVRHLFDALFPALKREFNGSMFDSELGDERQLIGSREIDLLRTFFRGDDLGNGQLTLGFWAYDFSVIPVEIISAIYEKFLGLEDPDEKQRKGAFYTPKNLAEMTVAEALHEVSDLRSLRFLDPSCGSGVFLVILFHYLAEEWQLDNPNATIPEKMAAMISFFNRNLRGVDVNKTACRLTCFSLYIALLDQFDPPILRKLKEEVGSGKRKPLLPSIMGGEGKNRDEASSATVLNADFFDRDLPLDGQFDFIIGNPPWVSRSGTIAEPLEKWIYDKANPFRPEKGASKSRLNEILIPQKQIAHAFLWKTTYHLTEGGKSCLILPSQLLTNRTDAFQKEWFERFETVRVIHLADFRRFLFHNAIRPCLLFHFSKNKPRSDSKFEYAVPKVSGLEPRSGLIPVCAEDRKWIRLNDLLKATKKTDSASIWKTLMWASPSDMELLQALKTLPKVSAYAGKPNEGKRWIKGKGFQPWYDIAIELGSKGYGEPKSIPGELTDKCLRSEDFKDFVVCSNDFITLEERLEELVYPSAKSLPIHDRKASKEKFRRAPAKELLDPPVLLVNKGFTRFAISKEKVFFQDSVTGISASRGNEDELYLLCSYLHSRLSEFFIFHVASAYGVERPEVRVHEVLDLPFVMPADLCGEKAGIKIIRELKRLILSAEFKLEDAIGSGDQEIFELLSGVGPDIRNSITSELIESTNSLIFQYFDLSEDDIAIIEDSVSIYKPSATPESPDKDIPTCRPISEDELLVYCEWLTKTLNRWAKASQEGSKDSKSLFHADYGIIDQFDLAVVVLKKGKTEKVPKRITSDDDLELALGKLSVASRQNVGPFDYLRGILHGTPTAIYLAKPALLGQWTRTRALDDAKNVFGAIATGRRNSAS